MCIRDRFMDRVVLAVDKLNFNVTADTKGTEGYKQMLKCSILAHFGAGLRDSIGKIILGAANPPDTVAAMLLAAEAVELEQAKLGAPWYIGFGSSRHFCHRRPT